ncbi:hypothetical protein HYX00_06695 [Candidatus Woesearchaeota archaeon]|nr:hypothetical protein [Candidatus Woesearchaeota archaeon]
MEQEQQIQQDSVQNESSYEAKDIQVLAGLSAVRKKINVIDLYHKIKRKGDMLTLSKELKIKQRTLALAKDEGRILYYFPHLEKSKASILARLKTNKELRIFAQKYDIYKNSARDLLKLVLKWNLDIQENPLLFLKQTEHDLIIGSLLGDASIRQRERNSCFRFTHSIKQKEYAQWKANILKEFEVSEFREVQRKVNNKYSNFIDFATKTHPVFNYYRELFYKNNSKIVDKASLEHLNPRSLAVWVCDDGSFSKKQEYIILCTNSFNIEEHKIMKEFFNKKFGLDPTIGFRDKKYYYLRFSKNDSKKLIEIIRPWIPDCMKYKIGE